jgi:hypothetical protein
LFVVQYAKHASIVIAVLELYEEPVNALPATKQNISPGTEVKVTVPKHPSPRVVTVA